MVIHPIVVAKQMGNFHLEGHVACLKRLKFFYTQPMSAGNAAQMLCASKTLILLPPLEIINNVNTVQYNGSAFIESEQEICMQMHCALGISINHHHSPALSHATLMLTTKLTLLTRTFVGVLLRLAE